MLKIHPTAQISSLAHIEDSLQNTSIVIDEGVFIDSFVRIKPAGGRGDIYIGPHTYINSGCVLYSGNGIHIGSGVLIAANCTLAPANHEYTSREKPIVQQRFRPSKGGIVVEQDVWIGANCVLLDGTKIGRGCVIGAGSVVRTMLAPWGIHVGTPLRKIGERV